MQNPRSSVIFSRTQVFFITLPKHTSKASTQNPAKQVKTPLKRWKPFKSKQVARPQHSRKTRKWKQLRQNKDYLKTSKQS